MRAITGFHRDIISEGKGMTISDKKRVVVAGATGTIGKALSKRLLESGYELVVVSRNPDSAWEIVPGAAAYFAWEPEKQGPLATAIDGAYGVVHLAGAPFFTRWKNADYKREIKESRLYGTHGLIQAMIEAKAKPEVFIYGSSVGYYGFEKTNRDMKMDEDVPAGNDFWGRDSKMLEEEAARAEETGVRTVMLRTGILLSEDSGPLPGQAPQYRWFMGGYVLPGTQWYPWIHIADEVGIIMFALEDERVHGPINLTAPEPPTNREFYRMLGKVLHRPSWIPMPAGVFKLFLGEAAVVVTRARRVVPKKALELGYEFQFPEVEKALRQLLRM
jgi:uncharacterized protein (TIGR01777 family)